MKIIIDLLPFLFVIGISFCIGMGVGMIATLILSHKQELKKVKDNEEEKANK